MFFLFFSGAGRDLSRCSRALARAAEKQKERMLVGWSSINRSSLRDFQTTTRSGFSRSGVGRVSGDFIPADALRESGRITAVSGQGTHVCAILNQEFDDAKIAGHGFVMQHGP